MPDVDLLIRTSNEYRISNFLLWQIAYAELHFTPVLWPDFNRHELFEALRIYQGRHRRFGAVADPATPDPDPGPDPSTDSRADAAAGSRADAVPGAQVAPTGSRAEPTGSRADAAPGAQVTPTRPRAVPPTPSRASPTRFRAGSPGGGA
jgi:hypothetical protein